MKKSYQISFAVIFLILGVAITLQFRSIEKNKVVQSQEYKSIQDVQAQLLNQKEYSESLLKQIEEDGKKISNYEKDANVEEMMKKDLQTAQMFAGLVDVTGKGITITIDDTTASDALKGIVQTNPYLVTDLNLLELINELRAAGAEAISINDERILATTEIRKAGYYMRINNKNYNSPFVIKVIGNPSVLQNSLGIREGIVEYLTMNKVNVTIQPSDNIIIPKYKGILKTDYISNTQ